MKRLFPAVVLAAFVVCFLPTIAAPAADDPAKILRSAPKVAEMNAACEHLLGRLGQNVHQEEAVAKNAQGDAAVVALRQFLLSDADRDARSRCARNLKSVTLQFIDPARGIASKTAYAADVHGIMIDLLKSPDEETRLIGTRAAWGSNDASLAEPLLDIAAHDPSLEARALAFKNIYWPMKVSLGQNPVQRPVYEAAIAAGLLDEPIVVAGALYAKAGLDGKGADPTLRTFATNADSIIRRGAIDAYDGLGFADVSIAQFLASRLADPERAVREAVMLQLFRSPVTSVSLPAFEAFSMRGPTSADRADAVEYLKALRRDHPAK